MAIPLEKFVAQLADSSLLSQEDVQRWLDALPAQRRPKDGEQLARELVRQKKLTAYQVQTIYKGQGKGLVLGNYVILDKLGQGGMGIVLKAQHKRMKRVVALKVLSPGVTKTPEALRRFQREVEAAAKLRHPNIVAADDADEAHGIHFLVMEYVEGSDLSALVKSHGVLPVDKALNCILQTARGLEYAHNHGVVHRDIKPANLLLDREGTVKILDMGLARLDSAGAQQDELTGTGQIMGTVDYMAPEQAMDTKHADARADVYSLGITLWYLLTNRSVYDAETMVKKLMAHQSQPIPSLCDACPEVSKELETVFTRMVAKKPEDRYQSMSEVIAALEACRAPAASAPSISAARSEDSRLDAFLHRLPMAGQSAAAVKTKAGVEAKPQTEPAVTVNISAPAQDTDPKSQMFSKPSVTPPASTHSDAAKGPLWRSPVAIAGGAALVLLLAALAVWIIIRDKDGNEVARLKIPDGGSATVQDNNATTTPGGKQRIQPIGPQPPLAKAPFGEDEAKQHQRAWADYLGVEVERDIELPGGEKLTMALIPPGEFLMSSTDEERGKFLEEAKAANDTWAMEYIPSEGPQHRVRISRPFYLGKYEVTQAQWRSVMRSNPSNLDASPAHPVEQVSWDDIQPFLAKLNENRSDDTMQFALPTEAQWEYACRAGTTNYWYGGNNEADLREYGWFDANSGGMTHPVGQLRPNAFGLYDLHGNVWEWCADWRAPDYYANSPLDDPSGPPTGSERVNRGGSGGSNARKCRSAIRGYYAPDYRLGSLGFRVAASIEPPPAKSPFGEAEAKRHQKAWADYLGVEVERDIELPGGEKLTMILIPPGEFLMGSVTEEQTKFLDEAQAANDPGYEGRLASEGPQHRVRITRPFYLGKYEVTQAQWQAVMGSNPSSFKDNPMSSVSWDDIQPFLARLNERGSAGQMKFALPTEAQWEYACRAGTTTAFSFGDSEGDLAQYGWFDANSDGMTHPVGQLMPNAFGLYDLHGNVWEWCSDWHAAKYYAEAPMDDPAGVSAGSRHVFRGGSWDYHAGTCRSASRHYNTPGVRYRYLGFRLAAAIVDG